MIQSIPASADRLTPNEAVMRPSLVWLCTIVASSCSSRARAPEPPRVIPDHGVIGGYRLGGPRTTALSACPRPLSMLPMAAHWQSGELEYAGSCPGVPAPMYLRVESSHPLFCDDVLCAVGFNVEVSDVVITLGEILSVLRERLGVAQGEGTPAECTKDASTIASCIRSGAAKPMHYWRTPDGIHIVLWADVTQRTPIVLFYATERGFDRLTQVAGGGRASP